MKKYVILLSGLPGTGKSTTAEKLSEKMRIYLISLIGIRRKMGYKKYSNRKTHIAMEQLRNQTKETLLSGNNIVLDSTFTSRLSREKIYHLSLECDAHVIVIECQCSEKQAKSRIRKRPKNFGILMEPRNPNVYDKLFKKRENVDADFQIRFPVHVSYIKYNTEKNEITEIKVNPEIKNIIDKIKVILT